MAKQQYVSWASSPAARNNAKANRRRDTGPEMAVRRRLHAQGLRYRVDVRPEPGLNRRADLVFSRARVAVFIDGCRWHSCPTHSKAPRTNARYWTEKLARNVNRDRDTTIRLSEAGWLVLRFWEHEDPDDVAATVRASVLSRAPK